MNKKNEDGETELHRASVNGDIDKCRDLIKRGADLNISDDRRLTALMYASSSGHYDIGSLLCDSGADVNVKSVNVNVKSMKVNVKSVNVNVFVLARVLRCSASGWSIPVNANVNVNALPFVQECVSVNVKAIVLLGPVHVPVQTRCSLAVRVLICFLCASSVRLSRLLHPCWRRPGLMKG